MNILITGGFGNIGVSVIDECLKRGHTVSVFDLESKRSRKLSKQYSKKSVRTIFGDIRNYDSVHDAIKNQDAIIHLAAILPPLSDKRPELCKEVNVIGVKNMLDAMTNTGDRAVLVEVSSASVMGPTQDKQPPIEPDASLVATDTYSNTKIEAEKLVEQSNSRYCILRLAAVLPTNINISYFINMIQVMFDMPLDARCEIVLDIDVACALVSAAENLANSGKLSGKKGFIAGGKENGCQLTNREMLGAVFEQIGLAFPRESLFSSELNGYYLDWYDTNKTQEILKFQNHSFAQWKAIIKKKLSIYHIPIALCRPSILHWLEKKSKKYDKQNLSLQ